MIDLNYHGDKWTYDEYEEKVRKFLTYIDPKFYDQLFSYSDMAEFFLEIGPKGQSFLVVFDSYGIDCYE